MEHITDQPLDLERLLDETRNPTCGALVVFEGTVRNRHQGQRVARMHYTAYRPLAERVLGELEEHVKRHFGVAECRIVHRVGDMGIGEGSVMIVVRAEHREVLGGQAEGHEAHHREEAFTAAKYAIDTLKVQVPVWKNDIYPDGSSAFQDGVPLSSCGEEQSGS